MADPRRLLDDPSLDPLARAVLRSADDDAAPGGDRRRAIAAGLSLGVGGSAAATAASAASGLWWKLPLVVIGLVGAGTTTYVLTRSSDATPTPIAAVEPAPAPHPASPAITPPAPAQPPPVEIAPPAPPPVAIAAPPAPPPKPSRPLAHASSGSRKSEVESRTQDSEASTTEDPAPPPSLDDSVGASSHVDSRNLAAEVALLDRARGELARSDTTAALATLDHHAAEFPAGALAAEAELLRIQTLVAKGDRAGAETLARRFVSRFPNSPLAPRARAILDGAPRSP